MARLRRYCPADVPQHVIQRGNNRSACFADNSDMAAYAHFLRQLWSPHAQYMALGASNVERQRRYRALFDSHVDGDLLADVRQSVNQGLALGSDKFRRQIEELGGRRQHLLKRGPRLAT